MDKTHCYLCDKPTMTEVTAATSFGFIVYPVCEEHFASFGSDVEMNVAVMERAIELSGKSIPVSINEVPGILAEAGLTLPSVDKEEEAKDERG